MLVYAEEEQEKGRTFHYSWLLILILFVACKKPTNYQGVDVPMVCRCTHYHNIWFEKDLKQKQQDNNVEFFLHGDCV